MRYYHLNIYMLDVPGACPLPSNMHLLPPAVSYLHLLLRTCTCCYLLIPAPAVTFTAVTFTAVTFTAGSFIRRPLGAVGVPQPSSKLLNLMAIQTGGMQRTTAGGVQPAG